jgi:dolichyl-phosphate beta-glucosyltransferase
MGTSPQLSLIVPAYNEVRAIGATLTAIQAYLDRHGYDYEVLVSADGDDGTREVVAGLAAKDSRLSVLGGPGRGGKGRGIRLAVPRCSGRLIGFLDADYKTRIDEIAKVLPWFDHGYDLVIGSRAMAESKVLNPQPFYRRLGSRAVTVVMHVLVGLREIHDTQCGFKFFRAPVARDLFARQRVDGYMFDVEILHLARRAGYHLKEVPVEWRDDGDSRLALISGNWQNMIDLFRIRFGKYPPPALHEASQRRAG